jgi:hypothetical protein
MLKQPADGGDLLKKRAGMIEEGAKPLVCDIHNYGCLWFFPGVSTLLSI